MRNIQTSVEAGFFADKSQYIVANKKFVGSDNKLTSYKLLNAGFEPLEKSLFLESDGQMKIDVAS